jgi:hypothetical protein
MRIVPEEFISQVVRMRNLLTHAGDPNEEKREPLPGGDLVMLSQKMRALLRGVFLLHLGLPESQIADVVTREATKKEVVRWS